MKVGWLIDSELFDEYRDDLVAQITDQGHAVKLIRAPSPPYRWEDGGCAYRTAFSKGTCVVAHGDINLVTRIHREKLWKPGVFATIENYNCSSYYNHFGKYLLNQNYIMLPFGELRRCKEFLMDAVGDGGQIFVRPDSPLKIFTGQVISADTYEKDLDYLAFHEFPASTLVIAGKPVLIEYEWRFVVANRRVVAGSQYKCRGVMSVQPRFDSAAMEYANTVADSEYQPDRAWVVDVCKTGDGDYRLLEIGAFSCCNLYECDKRAIVREVSQAAILDWDHSRNP